MCVYACVRVCGRATLTQLFFLHLQIRSFISFCGGLPAPEASNNPFGYKFSWSARGVLMAAGNTAKFLEGGKVVEIPASKLLSDGTKEIPIYPAFAFEGYPNRDSTGYGRRKNDKRKSVGLTNLFNSPLLGMVPSMESRRRRPSCVEPSGTRAAPPSSRPLLTSAFSTTRTR